MGVSTTGSDDEPSSQARVIIEKSDLRVDVSAPRRSLLVVTCMLVAVGAIAGPALTLRAAPVGYPVWAMTITSVGQLAVLVLVIRRRLVR